jgi:hypothetical protein
MTKSIIEKFEEQFGYCFNIGAVPDTITKKNIKQFLLTELQALKEEVLGDKQLEMETTGPLDYQDGFSAGYNDKREHAIEVFEKFGIK